MLTIIFALFKADVIYHFVLTEFMTITLLHFFNCKHIVTLLRNKVKFLHKWICRWKTIDAMGPCMLFTIPECHCITRCHWWPKCDYTWPAPNSTIHAASFLTTHICWNSGVLGIMDYPYRAQHMIKNLLNSSWWWETMRTYVLSH